MQSRLAEGPEHLLLLYRYCTHRIDGRRTDSGSLALFLDLTFLLLLGECCAGLAAHK